MRSRSNPPRAKKVWPEDAKQKIREMRALGATWRIIAVPFDCDWQVARNFYLGDGGLPCPAAARQARLRRLLEELEINEVAQ